MIACFLRLARRYSWCNSVLFLFDCFRTITVLTIPKAAMYWVIIELCLFLPLIVGFNQLGALKQLFSWFNPFLVNVNKKCIELTDKFWYAYEYDK
jgi:hypothetical protein